MADYSFIANPQVPNSFQTIGNMLNIANGAIQLQKNKATLGADIAQRQAESKQSQVASDIAEQTKQSVIDARRAEAQKSILSLNDAQRQSVAQFVMSLGSDSPEAGLTKLDHFKEAFPNLANAVDFAKDYVLTPASKDPQAWKQATNQIGLGVMSTPNQVAVTTPSGPTVSTGQQTYSVNTVPTAGPIGAVIPGTMAQQQLPPTTPTFSPQTNAPGYLGPQPALTGAIPGEQSTGFMGDPRAIQQQIINSNMPDADKQKALEQLNAQIKGQQQLQSGPALGAQMNIEGTAQTVNKDWEMTADAAKTAAQDVGVLQNIKKYAQGAVTGVESDRRAYVAGLAGLLNMSEGELAKTNTDVLAKNANMLALAGGNTDLARTIAESANPNVHMTPEAIKEAANQVIAQRELALSKQQFLRPFKGINDPAVYSKALTEFNAVADPRIFQLPEMNDNELISMKAAMSPAEWSQLQQKTARMIELGILDKNGRPK